MAINLDQSLINLTTRTAYLYSLTDWWFTILLLILHHKSSCHQWQGTFLKTRVAVVQFGPVQGYISPNPELDQWFGSGKSLNPNLN